MYMKRNAILLCLFLLPILTGCYTAPDTPNPEFRNVQSFAQLHLNEPSTVSDTESVIAAWIPYFTVEAMLTSDDPAQTENFVTAYLTSLMQSGVNTVFVHVCAFGESSYPSEYYPYLPAANGYDVMRLFSLTCEKLGLSFHAWINPLRLQTTEYIEAQSDDSLLQSWFQDSDARNSNFSEWNGRYFLNPASASTSEFLTGVISELITTYHPDGIHIDDYFYPTTEPAFDEAEFRASGADDLAAWRRNHITVLMQQMYSAVHDADPEAVFSVSPQGNLAENQNVQYADIPAWIGAEPYCDWLVPQLYFGYMNEKSPFDQLLRTWSELPRNDHVQLIVGLAAYKSGQPDSFAGTGANEWLETENLLAEQAADALGNTAVDGIALYHADALQNLPAAQAAALRQVIADHSLLTQAE